MSGNEGDVSNISYEVQEREDVIQGLRDGFLVKIYALLISYASLRMKKVL